MEYFADKDDKCPTVKGEKANAGCPWPDTDGDGVLDKDDKCPTVKGTVANNGCPEVSDDTMKKLNNYGKTILFNTGKSSFQKQTMPVLQAITAILKEYPTAKFSLEGHTDSTGSDVLNQKLSEKKTTELIQTMQAFRNLMDVFKVTKYKAFATSAMREAKNGPDIIKRVKKEANINIEIITGNLEAKMIYSSHFEDTLDHKLNYLYIDVGGGSTELSIFSKNKVVASHSFNIGTIRMLDNKDTEEEWLNLKNWIKVGFLRLVTFNSNW